MPGVLPTCSAPAAGSRGPLPAEPCVAPIVTSPGPPPAAPRAGGESRQPRECFSRLRPAREPAGPLARGCGGAPRGRPEPGRTKPALSSPPQRDFVLPGPGRPRRQPIVPANAPGRRRNTSILHGKKRIVIPHLQKYFLCSCPWQRPAADACHRVNGSGGACGPSPGSISDMRLSDSIRSLVLSNRQAPVMFTFSANVFLGGRGCESPHTADGLPTSTAWSDFLPTA